MIDDWPPDFLVETELPNGDLLVISPYAAPFREPGWVETILRPSPDHPTPIWTRVVTEQGGRDFGLVSEALTVLDDDEKTRYLSRVPQLRKRN